MSESSLWVVELPLLAYPSFELDTEQGENNTQSLVNQARNSMNWMILPFFSNSWYFGVILMGGIW